MLDAPILEFRGEYRWLSNFWPAAVVLDGIEYPTVEHAYQAAKTLDRAARECLRSEPRPGQVKRLGRGLLQREDWAQVKLEVMANLLRQKFEHAELRNRLLATGTRQLVEGNTWGDTFWGVCRGEGQNWLGRLLMEIREECRVPVV
jgi:ribA/ribD-fused uncharacterized protein